MSKLGYVKCCQLIGNGDFRKGRELFTAWALRMAHARAEHPVFAEGRFHALGVIGEELREFEHAVEHETPERMVDEALDEMATLAGSFSESMRRKREKEKGSERDEG